MKNVYIIASIAALFALSGCVTQVKVIPGITDSSNPQNRLGEMTIPDYKQEDMLKAADLVIKIINSADFEREVRRLVNIHATDTIVAKAWNGWTSEKIVKGMRDQIQGATVNTYGGPFALWIHAFKGNVAKDGASAGPVRMNRWGLKKRTIADLCNTIAHEVAHHVGMTHPHSETNLTIAHCEPPYIVGSIVKKLAVGSQWKWDKDDCIHMNESL